MKVRDIMSSEVDYVSPSTTLRQAAREMANHDFGFLPVGQEGRFVGVVTDRDLVVRGLAEGLDPEHDTLEKVYTHRFVSIYDHEDFNKAAELMEENQIRRLVVLDENDHIVGILAMSDIANWSGDDRLLNEIDHRIYEKRAA